MGATERNTPDTIHILQQLPHRWWMVLVALLGVVLAVLPLGHAEARTLTSKLEVQEYNATGSWQTFSFENSYTTPVVVCTHVLATKTAPSMTTRIRSVTGSSFQLKMITSMGNGSVAAAKVFCVISEQGAHTVGGVAYEAKRVTSTLTSGQYAPNNWNASQMVELTNSLANSYSTPVIMGQVMSDNDAKFSVFWTSNCISRSAQPFTGTGNRVCVGKHVGQDPSGRATETLGVIIAETAVSSANNVNFKIARGATSVYGTGDSPPYYYSASEDYDYAIGTQLSERGGNGGWAVLFGSDPLPATNLQWGIEEETVYGDTTRTHTNEAIGYWAFNDLGWPDIAISKASQLASDSVHQYSIPSSDLIYTVNVQNIGDGPAQDLLVIDKLPVDPATGNPAVSLFTGDMDGTGPASGPILFTDSGTSVTLPASAIGYSTAATRPTSLADCTSFSGSSYLSNARYICVQPNGAMDPGSFQIKYRVQIK